MINPSPASEVLHLLGQLSEGEVVLGGTASAVGVADKPFFARLSADGALAVNADRGVASMAALPYDIDLTRGRVVVGTWTGIRMFDASGQPVTSWGEDGNAGYAAPAAIALAPGGQVVAAWTSPAGEVVVRRLDINGSIDTSFNGTGSLTIPKAKVVADVAVAADGDVLVGLMDWDLATDENVPVRTNPRTFVRRYNADGTPDAGFGVDGEVDLRANPDIRSGELMEVGFAPDGTPWAFSRWPDVFVRLGGGGGGGATPTAVNLPRPRDGAFVAEGATVDAAGRMTVFGTWDHPTARESFVARYLADGSLDLSYGERGLFHVATHAVFKFWPNAADGSVVLGGARARAQPGGDASLVVMKVEGGEGAHDVRLNRKGTLVVNTNNAAEPVSLYIRQRDGRLVVRVGDFARSFAPSKVKKIAVCTFGGDDTITIGAGVRGAYGDAGDGSDTIHGGQGDDILVGGTGPDKIFGFDGNDTLLGGGGNDYLLGGAGKDDLFGQGGRDTLSGAGGNDRLFGGNDADRCLGGAGNDAAAQSDEDEFDSIETFLEA